MAERLEAPAILRDWLSGYTEREIAKRRNVSTGHVHKVVSEGELPAARVWVEDGRVVVQSALRPDDQALRVMLWLKKSGQEIRRG